MKLRITNSGDRDTVLMILGHNGYTVRQGAEKDSRTGKKYSYVEVVENDRRSGTDGGNEVVAAGDGTPRMA